MTDQSQSWKTGSADPPGPANSTNPVICSIQADWKFLNTNKKQERR